MASEVKEEVLEFVEIGGKAQSVSEAVRTRHSIREYQDRPIEADVLQRLLNDALRAPSWKNSQPWTLHVLSGAARQKMAEALVDAAKSAEPRPDSPWMESYPADAKRRMFDLGMKLYSVAGIERKDKAARDNFMLRNFQFFGAPTAIFITTHFELGVYTALDVGCLLNTILLLAREYGLGAVPQAALGAFPNVVRRQLNLPEEEKVICGLSLGYPVEDSNLNRFHAPRVSSAEALRFYD
ncbi:MAG: nitroreductase [Leptospirales bacterium]|nr:nitroreductase [Leptospirales bacterium]